MLHSFTSRIFIWRAQRTAAGGRCPAPGDVLSGAPKALFAVVESICNGKPSDNSNYNSDANEVHEGELLCQCPGCLAQACVAREGVGGVEVGREGRRKHTSSPAV